MAVRLTRDGYEKLRKEFDYLRTTKRREIIQAIAEARAHGDLRENAEYDSAKNEQGFLEKRISELEQMITNASILDNEEIDSSKVYLGATVTVTDVSNGRETKYMVVNKEEACMRDGKISVDSPVGKALLGKGVGDECSFTIPAGTRRLKIIDITR